MPHACAANPFPPSHKLLLVTAGRSYQVLPSNNKHAPRVLLHPRAIHVGYREPPPGSGQCTFDWARGRLFDKGMAEMFFEVGVTGEKQSGEGRLGGILNRGFVLRR